MRYFDIMISEVQRPTALPSFDEVVTPKMRAAFTQEFKRSYHGKEAFMTATGLDSWIIDWIKKRNLGMDDVLANPRYAKRFEAWLRGRYIEVIEKLTPLYAKPSFIAHRVIKVRPVWFEHPRTALGIYWTYDIEEWEMEIGAYAIWSKIKNGTEIVIEAAIQHASVDWIRTVRSHMDYYSGDREYELRVFPGVDLQVMAIRSMATKENLAIPKVHFTA